MFIKRQDNHTYAEEEVINTLLINSVIKTGPSKNIPASAN